MKKIFFPILVIAMFLINITNVKAYADVDIDDGLSALTLKGDVGDFSGDVSFTITQDSGFTYNVLLTKGNNYTDVINVVKDVEYTVKATISTNATKYKIEGVDDSYKVSGKEAEIDFKVTDNTLQATTDNTTNEVKDNTTNEVKDTNLLSKKEVYENYIKDTSFMENNSNYKNFFAIYRSDIMKKYFLDIDELNSEDDWKKMSDFEKWNYYILYTRPKTLIMGDNGIDTEDKLLSNLTSEEALLKNLQDGDKVIKAVKTVWKWEWSEWEKKGEFPNIYDEYEKGTVEKHSVRDLNSDYGKVDTDDTDDTVKENGIKSILKKNVFSLIVLVIIGIATATIIIIRKKKNYSKIEK